MMYVHSCYMKKTSKSDQFMHATYIYSVKSSIAMITLDLSSIGTLYLVYWWYYTYICRGSFLAQH